MQSPPLSFAQRFKQLRGRASYQGLSDAIFEKTGIRITPQAMHKWNEGGQINRTNARILADFFGTNEAWLLYGVGPERSVIIEDLIRELDPASARQVLDYIRYHLERHSKQLTADKMQTYLDLIRRIDATVTTDEAAAVKPRIRPAKSRP